nr:quinone oxidoreductase-like [Quercus suber]POF15528.1 quinone oxidoreductase [Quercus suber]
MRAINIRAFVTDPSTLRPSDVPTPSPKHDECLVRITHCSPQHADLLHAQGTHQNNNRKRGWCFPPFVLGYDFAGTVVSGPTRGGASFRRGDRVFGAWIGAFAEFICVPAARLHGIPAGLGAETACAMAGQAVSYAAVVHVAKVQAGETVMVSGASGGLGSVCCMVAKARGATVVALSGDEEKAKLMRMRMDVDAVVVQDGEGRWIREVLGFTNGKGVDVVLDNTGMVNDGIRTLAYFGRIVVLGFAARKGVMEEVKMNKLLLKSATVVGYRFGETGRRHPEELAKIWDGYLAMMQSGKLKPMLYGRYIGLEDVGRAFEDLEARKVTGKVVVRVARDVESAML